MKNNIYGILGVEAINSSWNNDFDGMPKTDGNGVIKGSPYALEYVIKRLWDSKGEKVLGLKTKDENKGNWMTLEGKYNYLFEEIKKKTTQQEVLENLMSCIDCKNFGVVFAKKDYNFGVRGVVQISDGINVWEDTNVTTETILSPYTNSNKDTSSMTTNGTRTLTDEAHYLYPFTITPNCYDEFSNIEYSEEDYENFKETSLKAVTLYNSKTKAGCKNEFGLFIKVKEEYKYQLALGDLTQYVKVYKSEDNKVTYDLTGLNSLLNECKDKIETIELYYRRLKNEVIGLDLEEVKRFDIITGKEF